MIYLDNAATSYPKPRAVIKSVNEAFKVYGANPGRGAYDMSRLTADRVYRVRELIAEFLNVEDAERVVFTQNATHALNLAIKSSVREKCHIITSDIEHNSVMRPLYTLKNELGCSVSCFNSSLPLTEAIPPLIRPDTRYIISTLSSNVSGSTVPIADLSRIAKENGLELIIDSSQLIGHRKIDLSRNPCNILCAPGHKSLLGPQGSGFAIIMDDKVRKTLIEGGSGNDSTNPEMPKYYPERFEAGTLSTPAICGLGAAIEYINRVSLDAIEDKIKVLGDCMRDMLDLKGVSVIGCDNGICSFTVEGLDSSIVAEELNNYKVAVRGGLHCAPSAHKKYGTVKSGTVRVSVSYFNKKDDIYKLRGALKSII